MVDKMLDSTDATAGPSDNTTSPPGRPASPLRPARLRFEPLEDRVMLAIDSALEATSDIMQASCMSAYFEQSSLYSNGTPTAFPTVDWITHLETQLAEFDREIPEQQLASAVDESDDQKTSESRKAGPLAVPGLGARAAGGVRKLLRADGAWPPHVFAPYVDMSATPAFDIVQAAEADGILYFNLAYIAADSANRASWCGDAARAIDGGSFDKALREQIAKLRDMGGDVTVSFGGPAGVELAQVVTDVNQLTAAYRGVVEAYGLKRVDFDLSGHALLDTQAVERRWQAVRQLQQELAKEGHPLQVWLTLPATREGLTPQGLRAVQSARDSGVELDGVNLKTSDNSIRPTTHGEKSALPTIEAAIKASYQLQRELPGGGKSGLWGHIGITPTMGRTRMGEGAFDAQDARDLYNFAEHQGLGMIGMCMLNGDGKPASTTSGSPQVRTSNEANDIVAAVTEIFRLFTTH